MNKLKNVISTAIFAVIFLSLAGCHASEKGYKAAYDAAVNKRQNSNLIVENEQEVIGDIKKIDGPNREQIGDLTAFCMTDYLQPTESNGIELSKYNVAIASYSMPTNALSQSRMLKENGISTVVAKGKDEKFYVIVGGSENLKEAAEFSDNFIKKNPNQVYVGMPGEPVIIFSPNQNK